MTLIGWFIILSSLIWVGKKLYLRLKEKTLKAQQKQLETISKKLHHQFQMISPQELQKKMRWIVVAGVLWSIYFYNFIPLVTAIIAYVYFPFVWIKWVERKRYRLFQKQLLEFFPFVSSVLRSGHTLEKAIEQACKTSKPPLSQEMSLVRKEMHLGQSFESALQHLLLRMPDPNLAMALSAIHISQTMGSNLAHAIDHIAKKIQEKESLALELKALTSQGRMQAWVTGLMPFAVVGALHFIAPGYTYPLFSTKIGICMLVYCFLSMGFGMVWIYKIVNQELLE